MAQAALAARSASVRIPLRSTTIEILETAEGLRCRSNLLTEEDGMFFGDDDLFEAGVQAIETLVLAHYSAGLDVQSAAYIRGLDKAADAILLRYA